MKQKMLSMVVASALVTAAVATATASAAPVEKQPTKVSAITDVRNVLANPIVNATLVVDGTSSTVKSIKDGSNVLYAAADLANALGASYINNGNAVTLLNEFHAVELTAGSVAYKLNGQDADFTVAPKELNGSVFVELSEVVDALGGQIEGSNQIHTIKVLSGVFSAPRFVNNTTVIVNKDDAETTEVYKLRTANNKNEVFSIVDEASTLVVSPDGKYGVYTNENAQLILVNTATGTSQLWSSDSSVKTDITWTADSQKIYFAQGDKQEKIGTATVDSTAVKTVLADKVENKADVHVSADGKKLLYTVNVTGVANSDKDSTEASLTIDYSKAGSQLFSLDLTKKDAKAVQLTKALDNKLYGSVLNDGRVVYISADSEGKVENDVLKVISADAKNMTDLVADANVIWDGVTVNDELIVATQNAAGTKVFALANDGSKKELYSTTQDVTEIAISGDGTQIALIADGKVVVVSGGEAVTLTK
ncbi:hypothetical protein BVG16_00805 [Paenibacillus selenitireducens]|uniref:Copper amine oxidase-like N-terminal domain-containing protein n=1 Tax=Paenibacillus selenitireducens TaxID=1324314 RepID=A0A1T2XM74_9BACL|nr:stalk domain-containing protein [Paenibacillus selenitireducens]OPA80922.1 hypothetical protein BVG16_00805 [Paenibacillus selenitireducens]